MPEEDEKNPPDPEGQNDKSKLVDLSSGEYVSVKKHNKVLTDLEQSKQSIIALEQQLRTEFEAEKSAMVTEHQHRLLQREIDHHIHKSQAHDGALVATLIDTTTLSLDDNGQLEGIEEQLEKIKQEKPFLFKQEVTNDQPAININFAANHDDNANNDALHIALKKKGMI